MLRKIFFSVSLLGNIKTIKESTSFILNNYIDSEYWIICRDEDLKIFRDSFQNNHKINIINEEDLLSFNSFIQLFYEKCSSLNISDKKKSESFERLKWYYQQILKLIFISYIEKKFSSINMLVMFDADSIPVKRIKFFRNENQSILYGSLLEKHINYIQTIELICNHKINYRHGFTTQFFSSTKKERESMWLIIKNFNQSKTSDSDSIKIANFVLISTLKTHGTLAGSGFSEQEFIGYANLTKAVIKHQVPILSFRIWHSGTYLSYIQIVLLKIIGYQLITYENRNNAVESKMKWMLFIKLLSRSLKYQLRALFYGKY